MKTGIVLVLSLFSLIWGAADLVLSNTETNGRWILAREISATNWLATPITTDGADYTQLTVTAEIHDGAAGGTLFMEVWSVGDFPYNPGSSQGRLTLSGSTPTEKIFTGSLALSANTSYFLVTGVEGAGSWWEQTHKTSTLGPDFNVDSGSWLLQTDGNVTIQDSYFSDNGGASWVSDEGLTGPLRMTIDAVPEPAVIGFMIVGAGVMLVTKRVRAEKE